MIIELLENFAILLFGVFWFMNLNENFMSIRYVELGMFVLQINFSYYAFIVLVFSSRATMLQMRQ